MATTNPNLLTNTRIPNAISCSSGTSSGTNTIRKAGGNIILGCKSGYQYDKNYFHNGLTPGDSGTLNDGGTYSTSYTAPSRFYGFGVHYEWFNGYVLYTYNSNYVFNIRNYTDSTLPGLYGELGCANSLNAVLTALDSNKDYLLVNKSYPNIHLTNIVLLIDFGFIPSYIGFDSTAHDLSYTNYKTVSINQDCVLSGTYSYLDNAIYINNGTGTILYSDDIVTELHTLIFSINFKSRNNSFVIRNYKSSRGYYIYIASNVLYLKIYDDGTPTDIIIHVDDTNIWHTIAISLSTTSCKIYVDGLRDSDTFIGRFFGNDRDNIIIGDATFDGSVGNFRIYSTDLTANNILDDFESTRWLTDPYRTFVNSLGGDIFNYSTTSNIIEMLRSNSSFTNTLFLWGGEMGYIKRTSTIYDYYTTACSYNAGTLISASQSSEANQPFIGGNIAPNEKLCIKNNNGLARYLSHTAISFTDAQPWSATFVLNNNGTNLTLEILNGTFVFYTKITTNRICIYSPTNTNSVRTVANSFDEYLGKNTVVHITVDQQNVPNIYYNGVLQTLESGYNTSVLFPATFNKIFSSQSTNSTFGDIKYYRIQSGAMTAPQVLIESNYLQTLYPEIESVTIGTQQWSTSNWEAVCTPVGNVIQEMQAATASEKVTISDNRDFTNWANVTWVAYAGATISDGTSKMQIALNPGAVMGQSGAILSLPGGSLTNGRWYKVVVDVWKGTATHSNYFVQVGGQLRTFTITGSQTTYTLYIKANTTQQSCLVVANGNTTDSGTVYVDNYSCQELGWANTSELYTYIYDLTAGTAAQKEYAALKEAGMWCYYNNDSVLGSIYGKLYNWYAVRLFDLDFTTSGFGWHVPNLTEFTLLETFLGGSSISGGKLKMTKLNYWSSPNTGSTNETGFTGLGNGYRWTNGQFLTLNTQLTLWGVTTVSSPVLIMSYNSESTTKASNDNKTQGFAVRIMKN